MIIKIIIFLIIAYIMQLDANNWYNILIFSFLIGLGSKSFKQSIYLGALLGSIPWLIEFLIQFSNSKILLNKIANMFGLNSSILLIFISILFISILCIIASLSGYYTKSIYNDKK